MNTLTAPHVGRVRELQCCRSSCSREVGLMGSRFARCPSQRNGAVRPTLRLRWATARSPLCRCSNKNGAEHSRAEYVSSDSENDLPRHNTSRKGQQTANEGMSSIDPFTSFDNGAARDRVILESIAARTARTAATSSAPNSERFKNLPPFLQKTMQNMGDWPGAEYLKYKYYNYRKGTSDDLKLFVLLNGILLIALGLSRAAIGDRDLWGNLYTTAKLIFGEFDGDDALIFQVFSLVVATGGFLGFALVLALVEQSFLEVLEGNVRVGSPVFECNHILLLAFGRSPRDKEMLLTVTRQLLQAHKDIGGTTIVIMTEIPKLELETWFRKTLGPEFEDCRDSTLVFRQGNPLLVGDLQLVNAAQTSATLILGDQSRGPVEADAQTTRIAVLLDELLMEDAKNRSSDDSAVSHQGHVLVEVQNQETLKLVQYSCSARVIPVATARLNTRRLVRMLRQPIIGLTSRQMWDFGCDARAALELHPELTGCLFKEAHFRFADIIVLGVLRGEKMYLCPPDDLKLEEGDELLLVRKTGSLQTDALPMPLPTGPDTWEPKMSADDFVLIPPHVKSAMSNSCDEAEVQVCEEQGSYGNGTLASRGFFVMPDTIGPRSAKSKREAPMCVLVAGWKTQQFMSALAYEMDRGQSQLPRGSHVTFFNEHGHECLDRVEETVRLNNVTTNHVYGSPLKKKHLGRLEMTKFDTVLVLCDEMWMDPDQNMTNGYDDINTQGDLLRLESVVLMAQLNIRMILHAEGKELGIVAEKMAYGGVTRFEDLKRLPTGISINFTSFSAKMLAFLAYYPKLLVPYFALGEEADITVFDSSWICDVGEFVSFVQLQQRALKLNHVLMGYYELPGRTDNPLQLVVNPQSAEVRLEERVWNIGIGHLKFLALCPLLGEPEEPLISRLSADELPDDPDDFTTMPDLEEDTATQTLAVDAPLAAENPSTGGAWPF